MTYEIDTDSKGRAIRRKAERNFATRELSVLQQDAGVKRLDLPQLNGGDPRPFEVVGIPINEPGYHVVEAESLRLGQSLLDQRAPMFVRTGVLVTNLGVHFKFGRENSVVWVTKLDRGKPVEGAEVAVNDCTDKSSDPVPGGATILGSGLGRDSAIATRTEKRSGNAWPAYEERSFEAFCSYFEYLPKGKHVIEYTVRLNNPGKFSLPPTRVEAMYAPETFGESPNAMVDVAP